MPSTMRRPIGVPPLWSGWTRLRDPGRRASPGGGYASGTAAWTGRPAVTMPRGRPRVPARRQPGGAEAGQAIVPAPAGLFGPGRQVVERGADGDEPRLPTGPLASHQAGVPQQPQVLGHRLAADRQPVRQRRGGHRAALGDGARGSTAGWGRPAPARGGGHRLTGQRGRERVSGRLARWTPPCACAATDWSWRPTPTGPTTARPCCCSPAAGRPDTRGTAPPGCSGQGLACHHGRPARPRRQRLGAGRRLQPRRLRRRRARRGSGDRPPSPGAGGRLARRDQLADRHRRGRPGHRPTRGQRARAGRRRAPPRAGGRGPHRRLHAGPPGRLRQPRGRRRRRGRVQPPPATPVGPVGPAQERPPA